MNLELRRKLERINKKLDYGINDKEIAETIIECGKQIKEYNHSKHRWYTTYNIVKKIEGIFVDFISYSNSGDEAALDTEEWHKMVLESVIEVEPYKKTIIDYREIKIKNNVTKGG